MQTSFDPDRLAELQRVGEAMNAHCPLLDLVNSLPRQPQRQDSTNDQLRDLRVFANRLGMYDAADLIRGLLERSEG